MRQLKITKQINYAGRQNQLESIFRRISKINLITANEEVETG